MTSALHFSFDAGSVTRWTRGVSALLEKLPPEVVQRFVCLLDRGFELFRFEADCSSAGGADHILVCAQPSDLLLDFIAAAGAANSDLGLVDDALCHIESSLPVATISAIENEGETAR